MSRVEFSRAKKQRRVELLADIEKIDRIMEQTHDMDELMGLNQFKEMLRQAHISVSKREYK